MTMGPLSAWPVVPHGADLNRARRMYGDAPGGRPWLDLSSGIHPEGWPVSSALAGLSPELWRELPQMSSRVLASFSRYYGMSALPVPGSQAAIQALPRVWRRLYGPARVQVLSPGYGEHAARWALEGHDVRRCPRTQLGQDDPDVVVICHPNNPTGERFASHEVSRLAASCRWLVIDEAFVDAGAEPSHVRCGHPNVLVLRSLGKFFGLAGLRVGAVLGPEVLRAAVQAEIGPWAMPAPVLHLAALALDDLSWQRGARLWLARRSLALGELLHLHGLDTRGTALFRTAMTPRAGLWQEALARRGIWTRLFDLPAEQAGGQPYQAVRFGLPGHDDDMLRLDEALRQVRQDIDS